MGKKGSFFLFLSFLLFSLSLAGGWVGGWFGGRVVLLGGGWGRVVHNMSARRNRLPRPSPWPCVPRGEMAKQPTTRARPPTADATWRVSSGAGCVGVVLGKGGRERERERERERMRENE